MLKLTLKCVSLKAKIITTISGLLFASLPLMAADTLPFDARQELDAIVAGQLPGLPETSGLQVLVIQDGRTAFEYASGTARFVNGQSVQLGLEHKMRVASISKLVATIGLLRLVEEGKVSLDVDISDYLGFSLRNPNFPGDSITLRMVLSHTSSIRDGSYYWLKEGEAFREFFISAGKHYDGGAHFASGSGKAPGSYFTYSNLNFGIMAGVIEKVTGRRFDKYMREAVLKPLGLSASFNVCDVASAEPETMATLFRKRDSAGNWQPDGDWIPQLDDARLSCFYGMEPIARGQQPGPILEVYTPGSNPTLFSPQGGLRASARDLGRIAAFLLQGGSFAGKQLLSTKTVDKMVQPVWVYNAEAENGSTTGGLDPEGASKGLMTAYGLSTHIVDLQEWGLTQDHRYLVGHLGDAYGLMGQFWIDFDSGTALIALITGTSDNPVGSGGVTPLYRAEEEVLRWWLRWFDADLPKTGK